MIPEFPEFKKLELSDKVDIESFSHKYPPYSDFNFMSMWAWDINGDMRLSQLNGNLVVKFTDYLTSRPFYSFIGNNNLSDTLEKILDMATKEGLEPKIRLLPEEFTKEIDQEKFRILEDRDHFDYIIPVEIFKEYNTKKTRTKKNSVKQFLKNFSPKTEVLDISDKKTQALVASLLDEWGRSGNRDIYDMKNELQAIERFMNCQDPNMVHIGVFIGSNLVGFCFTEKINDKFASIHFCKANVNISPGLYSFILQEKARILSESGHQMVNIEQDLGIPSMRQWKESLGSNTYLKKYAVTYK